MGVEYLQSNLTAGELAPTMRARTDTTKYANGVAEAENMIILPHGGMRRRPGLAQINNTRLDSKGRLAPFVFNTQQKYVIVFRPGFIDVYFNDAIVAHNIVSPYNTDAMVKEADVIQSADTMIITHQEVQPHSLVRGASHGDWTLAPITLQIPQYDFGSGTAEDTWSDARGWPRVCTFHQGRLWFAGSTSLPTSIWGSKINGFFDFTAAGSPIPDDHAIFDTLNTDEYNIITNIFSGRDLQIFTTAAEFYNSEKIITPSASTWVKQTGYGSKRLRPILIDGATMFVDSSKRTIRQYVWTFQEGSYISVNITLLSSHLVTDAVSMSAVKGTEFDISDFLYVVNADGSLAVLNTMRHEEIAGWTHWNTDGKFIDVVVLDKEVYFEVERNGAYFLEKLAEGTFTDHNSVINGTEPTTDNVTLSADNVVFNTDNVVFTNTSTGSPVTEIQINYDAELMQKDLKVIADYSVQDDQKPQGTAGNNKIVITRNAYRLEAGLEYNTKIVTLPISTETQSGTTYHRRRRVVKADINVVDSLGVYARKRFTGDRSFTVVLDKAPTPFTGFKEMYLLGYDRELSIEISQNQPLPFILRAIGFEVEY